MAKNATIHARIEDNLKNKVEKILNKLGISHSEAINIYYSQLALHKGLPFEVKIANKETIKAFKETANKKNLIKYKNKHELFEEIRNL